LYAKYDEIVLNWSNEEVEYHLEKMAMTDFQLHTHPVFFRNRFGELVPAKPFSKEAGFKRDRRNGNLLTKL
jgi:hypothetical protein